MKILYVNLTLTMVALHFLLTDTNALMMKRCQSVCSRSDGQEFCQRCRMRVPMRFGKRTDMSRNTDSKKIQQVADDNDDASEFDVSTNHKASSSSSMKAESRLLLNSMRNFISDLEEWNRDLYDE